MFNDNTDPMLDTNMVDRLEQKVHMMEELGIDDPITFSSRALIQATFPHSKKHADEESHYHHVQPEWPTLRALPPADYVLVNERSHPTKRCPSHRPSPRYPTRRQPQ